MGLKRGCGGAYGVQGGWMGEDSIKVFNRIIFNLVEEQLDSSCGGKGGSVLEG